MPWSISLTPLLQEVLRKCHRGRPSQAPPPPVPPHEARCQTTWSDLPWEVQHLVAQHLRLHDLLSLRATGRENGFALSAEMFDREIWSAATPDEARKLARNLNIMYKTNRSHPILEIDAEWNRDEFCASALDYGDAQEGWQLLAWARANGCPWSQHVRNVIRILTVPAGVAALLPHRIFAECASLTTVRIPAGINSLPDGAFYRCVALTSVELPPGLVILGDDCFRYCTALPRIRLPDSVTTLGCRTFFECIRLKSVELSQALAALGDDTFRDCRSLSAIRLPDSIRTTLGNRTFYGCSKLTDIEFPRELTALGCDCCRDCTALRSIRLSDSIITLGDRTFSGCAALITARLPGNLRHIGETPFHDCPALTEVVIPDPVPTSIRLKLQ